MKKQRKKRVPKFSTEDREQEFWSEADATEYFDFSEAKKVDFPNLKPSTKSISIRLPESMINQLKSLANEQDVPYQSLIKIILSERLKAEKKTG